MSKVNLNILVVVCALIMALSGPAAVGATIHVPVDYPTIQLAINNAAILGDEIEVAPGTYNEAINFNGKAVRLYSRGGPEVTIIDANGIAGAYHVVQCINGELRNTVLEGFTITGGNANGIFSPDNLGGGILCVISSPTIVNCIVTSNHATYGGGIFTGGIKGEVSNPAIIGCKICYNEAYLDGGGLFFWSDYPAYPQSNYPVMINCEIYNNSADNGGGVVSSNSKPTITNCTFSANEANTGPGGALASWTGVKEDAPVITNCILWGDTPWEIAFSPEPPIVQYSDVQGGTGQIWFGTGCIDVNAEFVNAAGGNLQLSPASLCRDAGLSLLDTDVFADGVQPLPEDDLNGSHRIYPINVDMGAYEHRDSDGDGTTDGFDIPSVHNLTRGTDHFTIQAAINGALSGDEIEVLPGTYNESINFKDKAVRVYSSAEPEVTIIDANGIANTYHVVQCISSEDANTVLEGFTITGGVADGAGTYESYGGGILCVLSSPTIAGCIVTDNAAVVGGGIQSSYSAPTISGCIVTGNAAVLGGGIHTENSNLAIIGCKICYNVAVGDGGGLYFYQYYPVMINCEIYNNWATDGGGMVSNHSQATITNCTFSANVASVGYSGALASLAHGEPNTPYIINCILWGDTPAEIVYDPFAPFVLYCDVQGIVWPLAGNISADPCFVDADANDFRLLHDSPCIDMGFTAVDTDVFTPGVQPLPEDDLNGHPRILDGDCNDTVIVDMGAFEFNYAYMGDFDYNCTVDFKDFAVFAMAWLTEPPDPMWNRFCDIGIPSDDYIDLYDLDVLVDNWLAEF